MIRAIPGGRQIAAIAVALCLVVGSAGSVFAHARFDRAEPPLDMPFDGTPMLLKTYYTQELTSKSTVRVLDSNGVQVDLGDGHVDLDDPIRKTMLVSLPELPVGVYTIEFVAESAEDGHAEPGTVTFGVGMLPPAAEEPAVGPVEAPAETPADAPSGMTLDAALPLPY
ncbi:MAG: copper resistance protein CopC [Chloroflexota bacterium]